MNKMGLSRRHTASLVLLSLFGFFLLKPTVAIGHALGENYVFLNIQEAQAVGRFEFSFDDLNEKLGMSLDRDDMDGARVAAAEKAEQLWDYILKNVNIYGDGQELEIVFSQTSILGDDIEGIGVAESDEGLAEGDKDVAPVEPVVEDDSDLELAVTVESGPWVQYHFTTPWDSIPDILTLDHRMMMEGDRFHRMLLVVSGNAKTDSEYNEHHIVRVYGRNNNIQSIDLREPLPAILSTRDFLWQGVLHIWIGIDHILFLAVLLLPAVLRREKGQWVPVDRFSQGLWNVFKIVTVFTVAHSITLGLAALELVRVPSSFVESVIAASIVVVALNNIWPKVKLGSLWMILGFGLFHGLGFASVMGELPFRMMDLKKVILLFNVGVELGQLAIVAVVFSLLFMLRRMPLYRPAILVGGSAVAAVVAAFWFAERAFGI